MEHTRQRRIPPRMTGGDGEASDKPGRHEDEVDRTETANQLHDRRRHPKLMTPGLGGDDSSNGQYRDLSCQQGRIRHGAGLPRVEGGEELNCCEPLYKLGQNTSCERHGQD